MSSVRDRRKRAKELGLERKIRLFERGWPWLGAALLLSFLFLVLLVLFLQGRFTHLDPDVWGPVARGYSAYGELLGVLAVLLVLLTFTFSLRKRALQERFPIFRGSMMAWLWVHVAAGALALGAATLHAGFGLFDYDFSTGKLIYWMLLFIAITGAVWRLVYSAVPKTAVDQVGNYSREATLLRAKSQEIEIEKRTAGKGELLQGWKRWLLERPRTPAELNQAKLQFAGSPDEALFAELCELAASRHRAMNRSVLQGKYVQRLQGWRVLHVPLSLLFLVLVVVHVVEVYDWGPKVLPREVRAVTGLPVDLTGNHDPKDCRDCHRQIYDQWEHSMHAHALTSPVMVAQSNQVTREILNDTESPDPKRICVYCHSPLGTELADQELLPFPGGKHGNQGITCLVCHQFTGETTPVGGAYSHGLLAGIERGRVMYGPFSGAVGNPYHQSKQSPVLTPDPFVICQNCHNVALDRNGNDRIDIGPDLVLQTTGLEYLEYRKTGGTATCGGCHMPVMANQTRSAEAAPIPDLQDTHAPKRLVHDHSFVGTDHPLDVPGAQDPHREKRVKLLQSAATFTLVQPKFDATSQTLTVSIDIKNTGTGHTLPTGFAFARQMWVELIVKDAGSGTALFASGLLARNTDDLCDTETLDPQNPMAELVQGCRAADPQLLSFQKKLVSHSEVLKAADGTPVTNAKGEQVSVMAEQGKEASIQHLTGNAVVRKRPSDGQLMGALDPGESRSFAYQVVLPQGTQKVEVSARLLFRNLPPYFLRDLARKQPPDEVPQLAPLIGNLDIVEMAARKTRVTL